MKKKKKKKDEEEKIVRVEFIVWLIVGLVDC